jgi:hypothetical protein
VTELELPLVIVGSSVEIVNVVSLRNELGRIENRIITIL